MVGSNAEDIRLSAVISVEGSSTDVPYERKRLSAYYTGMVQDVDEKTFETLLGYSVPKGSWSGELGINDAICQMYYAKSRLARLAYRFLVWRKKKSEDRGKPDLNILFIYNMPFRGIAKMTGGAVSMEMAYGMVDVVNGHFWKGMKRTVGGYFRNRKENKAYEKQLAVNGEEQDE